jgi:hypothetical protein
LRKKVSDGWQREIAVRVYGVRVIAIDSVNELDHEIQKGETATEYLRKFIMTLKKPADDYGLLIICCAHPPKDGTEKRLAKSGFLTFNDGADTAHGATNPTSVGVFGGVDLRTKRPPISN